MVDLGLPLDPEGGSSIDEGQVSAVPCAIASQKNIFGCIGSLRVCFLFDHCRVRGGARSGWHLEFRLKLSYVSQAHKPIGLNRIFHCVN